MLEFLLRWWAYRWAHRRARHEAPIVERRLDRPYDPRLDGVLCKECLIPLSYRIWQSCSRPPEGCWASYAINEYALMDADAAEARR